LRSLNGNDRIRLFPQPAGKTINLVSEAWTNQTVLVSVIHLTGKLLKSQWLEADTTGAISFEHQLPPGIYFIKASHKGNERLMKMLVE
jgi:hypothetical protein